MKVRPLALPFCVASFSFPNWPRHFPATRPEQQVVTGPSLDQWDIRTASPARLIWQMMTSRCYVVNSQKSEYHLIALKVPLAGMVSVTCLHPVFQFIFWLGKTPARRPPLENLDALQLSQELLQISNLTTDALCWARDGWVTRGDNSPSRT